MLWNLPNITHLDTHRRDPADRVAVLHAVSLGGSGRGAAVRGRRHHGFAGRLLRAALGQISRLGAFLDPVADKLIVAVALVLLVSKDSACALHRAAPPRVIIGREITISALREWMAEIGARRKVAVSQLGKYKTILQIIGLSMMLFRWPLLGLPTYRLGVILTGSPPPRPWCRWVPICALPGLNLSVRNHS